MRWPSGTTIVDVADPRHPRQLATIDLPEGWHSHKVRACERHHDRQPREARRRADAAEFGGGIAIYDVSRPSAPKLISKWLTAGRGVHRYDFDGRYAYISPTAEGYVGNIMMILDLADPARPVEVGRWWIPGQWKAGGEPYPWDNWVPPRCHHPLRMGDRLYVSYWHHGLFILDISRHVAAESGGARQYQPGVSASDPHLPADPATAQGSQHHGGGGRGRRQAAARGAFLHLDLRHHGRAGAGADRDLPGARSRHATAARSRR